MLQRHDMLQPPVPSPAGTPRPAASARILIGFVVVVAFVAVLVAIATNSGRPVSTPPALAARSAGASQVGAVPPVDSRTSPSLVPESTIDPTRLKACVADGLAMSAGGWSGATG